MFKKYIFIIIPLIALSITACHVDEGGPGPSPGVTPQNQNPIVGNTYYIDATNGNDGNGGTTVTNAWKTLDRIRKTVYGPSDKILLKRGEDWAKEILFVGNTLGQTTGLSNGSAGNFIKIDTYGTGDNPKIYMLTLNRIGYIEVHNITVTKRVLDSEYPVKVQHCNNILIEDCSIPGMYTDYSSDMTLRKVVSSNNAMEHGLYLCTESKSITVEDCVFANNHGSGIQTNGSGMDSIIVQGCIIYKNGNLQNGGSGYNDVRSNNVTIRNNIFIDGYGKAVESMNPNTKKYYNNVFVSTKEGIPAVGMSNADASIIFKNNIFYVRTDAITGVNKDVISDYNCFYAVKTNGAPTFNWATTFANWKTQTSNDLHSLAVDPKFISIDLDADPSAWNLQLQGSSTLFNAGVDVGLPFTGKAPDIGLLK
jgi:hypothetical protein